MKKIISAALFAGLLLLPVCGFAVDENAGTGGAAFMKLGAGSPRAQALGEAYVALAEGADSMVWNPAGLGYSQQREVYFTYLKWFQDYDGKMLAYVHPIGQTVFGVNAAYMTMDGFDARDANDVRVTNADVNLQNSFVTASVARAFFVETLSIGASVKGVMENYDGTRYSNVVYDIGAQLKVGKRIRLGYSLMNMGQDKSKVVQIRRAGAALLLNSFLTITGEVMEPSDNATRTNVGLEINFPEEVLQVGRACLRVGYRQSENYGKNDSSILKTLGLQNSSKITMGMGLYSSDIMGYGVGIDYALLPFGELGTAHQLGIKILF